MARDLSIIDRVGNSRRAAYVVFIGRNPGVYLSWKETKMQVHQFSGNDYKGFDSLDEAREALINIKTAQAFAKQLKST
ncbi:ribonuclease H-like protein [Alteromonas mediterranea 615]|uniref:Ribonuclease H-like protein n=1 Tax=Alteromonas mediterranea 615 TaxID=1300253 RepID=S5AJ90_9ALTE|nr:ribonuclease H-like protein [Alteromonas mediterranea 615]